MSELSSTEITWGWLRAPVGLHLRQFDTEVYVVGMVEHRFVTVNGVRLHVAEQGEGPLVLLLHGFPESWYSWRHQIAPLAAAGYRAVAPDQRGYAGSERPEAVEAYSLLHLAGDIIGLVDALGEKSVVLVGRNCLGGILVVHRRYDSRQAAARQHGASTDWFNPSIAHHSLCSSEHVFRCAVQIVKTIPGQWEQAGNPTEAAALTAYAVPDNPPDPESAALGLSRCLGRTGPAASRARRAAHHPAGSFTTRLWRRLVGMSQWEPL
jgi:hypothetical protein